jgi:hypothetical protein
MWRCSDWDKERLGGSNSVSKVKHCESPYGRFTTPEISELIGDRLVLFEFELRVPSRCA